MSARKLPDIAPCMCPKHCKATVIQSLPGQYRALSDCGFAGPPRYSVRTAREAWNRRSDDAAERRGAMAAANWLLKQNEWGLSQKLEQAVDRGEVFPKAQNPEPWIVSNPGVMGGKPCVRGTRITVETIRNVSKHWPFLQILTEYPSLTPESLASVLVRVWREDEGRLPKAQKRGRRG